LPELGDEFGSRPYWLVCRDVHGRAANPESGIIKTVFFSIAIMIFEALLVGK